MEQEQEPTAAELRDYMAKETLRKTGRPATEEKLDAAMRRLIRDINAKRRTPPCPRPSQSR